MEVGEGFRKRPLGRTRILEYHHFDRADTGGDLGTWLEVESVSQSDGRLWCW